MRRKHGRDSIFATQSPTRAPRYRVRIITNTYWWRISTEADVELTCYVDC